MAFYYLHILGTDCPKNEKGFKYFIYSEKELFNIYEFQIDSKEKYCFHKLDSKPKCSIDDDIIEIENPRTNTVLVKFVKIFEEKELIIWYKV